MRLWDTQRITYHYASLTTFYHHLFPEYLNLRKDVPDERTICYQLAKCKIESEVFIHFIIYVRGSLPTPMCLKSLISVSLQRVKLSGFAIK